MGCDIHMWAEKRVHGTRKAHEIQLMGLPIQIPDEKPRWVFLKEKFKARHYDPSKPTTVDPEDGWISNPEYISEPYWGRNYLLFSVLAGVRGDVGCLFADRGVPTDASPEYLQMVEDMHGDGHSHSFCTLAELDKVDWALYNKENYLDDFLGCMKKLLEVAEADPEDVRIVFYFDN
jgi:hypothetical protein